MDHYPRALAVNSSEQSEIGIYNTERHEAVIVVLLMVVAFAVVMQYNLVEVRSTVV